MCDWLKRIFGAKVSEALVTTDISVTTMQSAPVHPPLYFLDIDEDGDLFVRYVHVTSSVNAGLILKNGLQPLENAKQRLVEYLQRVFPTENAVLLLDAIAGAKASKAMASPLVNMRIEEERQGTPVVALLPLGETSFLGSAKNNAVQDGGEFFMAARKTVNALKGKDEGPLFPDATAVIFIARHYIEQRGESFLVKGVGAECFELDFVAGLENNFIDYWGPFGQPWPIHVNVVYPPAHLVMMDFDAYLAHPKEPISPMACRRVKEIVAQAQGSVQ